MDASVGVSGMSAKALALAIVWALTRMLAWASACALVWRFNVGVSVGVRVGDRVGIRVGVSVGRGR